MKTLIYLTLLSLGVIAMTNAAPPSDEFAGMHNLEAVDGGLRITAPGAWIEFKAFKPSPPDGSYLLMEVGADKPFGASLLWRRTAGPPFKDRTFHLQIPAGDEHVTRAIDLGVVGGYREGDNLRLDIHAEAGTVLDIRNVRLVSRDAVPADLLPSLIDFRCYTSKLHYLPGEPIEYKASMQARNVPDRESSKVLTVRLLDEKGSIVATDVQQYGLQPAYDLRELFGVLRPEKPLAPGKYTLQAESRDQRTGLVLKSAHEFGIQGKDDPLLYETPFRFVKDFSIVRGPDGLWHVFSITGEFFGGHDWYEDGQERTFSHGTSPDLRHWTYHPPVLSVSDDPYPDGNGRYKDRNVWAPHVIRHGDTYYMFCTSVNRYASQTISVATSKDLFNWEEHSGNPVFTLEGVEWANWGRTHFSSNRDPMVLVDGDRFYLYVTAEAREGDRGIVVVAESGDLIHWRNPRIAVRAPVVSESAQVWKNGDTYYMVTSSVGAATYTSKHPVTGWMKADFPRPPVRDVEKYVNTSHAYAEEVVRLEDGSFLMAACTFRHWGNSIYFFRMKTNEQGTPIGYESPFTEHKSSDE